MATDTIVEIIMAYQTHSMGLFNTMIKYNANGADKAKIRIDVITSIGSPFPNP